MSFLRFDERMKKRGSGGEVGRCWKEGTYLAHDGPNETQDGFDFSVHQIVRRGLYLQLDSHRPDVL